MRRAVVLVLALTVVAAAAAVLAAQVTQPGPTYPLWEYRTEIVRERRATDLSEGSLNALGREGWDLAGFSRREVRVDDVMQTETVYVFKRSRGEARR